MTKIPQIDLDDVAAFQQAFEDYGFAVLDTASLANSSPSSTLLTKVTASAAKLRTAAYAFFRQSHNYKQNYSSGGTYGPPGWAQMGLEMVNRSMDVHTKKNNRESTSQEPEPETVTTASSSFAADAVESFVYHGKSNQLLPPELIEPLQEYWTLVNQLLEQVMQTCALSQGLEADFFVPFYTPHRSCALRLAYYPAGNSPKYGAHRDYTGFTLLNAEKSGLEVLYNDEWIPVPSPSTAMVLNAGDLIPLWTNGRLASAIHRVVPTDELKTKDRLSVVFFTGPGDDHMIEPIVVSGEEERPKYQPIRAGDHLQAKLASTNR